MKVIYVCVCVCVSGGGGERVMLDVAYIDNVSGNAVVICCEWHSASGTLRNDHFRREEEQGGRRTEKVEINKITKLISAVDLYN